MAIHSSVVGKDPSKIGIITGQVMKKLTGNADGNDVKAVLAELLK
jgi:Asp-tRNA(Asn)/Glu-tRNA(Gln) amidotransferase B subunit